MDGNLPTTGCVIATRGISSAIRGLKHHTARVDIALIDDIQTSEDASNPDSVQKLFDILRKDVMNLSGKGRLCLIACGTTICDEDLCSKIASDTNWKTTKFPSIIKWPNDIIEKGDKGLWGQYFKIYDKENIADLNHDESLNFYR
jgi:hypothetical protein